MGRKKKELPPAKTRKFSFRMTEDMYDLISTYAEKANISITEYVRLRLIDKEPSIRYEIVFDNPELLKTLKDLGKVGGNLNQIAQLSSDRADPNRSIRLSELHPLYPYQGGTLTENIRQEITKCISVIYGMRDNIQEMAGNYRGSNQTHSS